MDNRKDLKIKVKTLVCEIGNIRHEERKLKGRNGETHPERGHFEAHRRKVVQPELRATLAAYGCIRGRPFAQVESASRTLPNMSRVKDMVTKYGSYEARQGFADWAKAAQDHVTANQTARLKDVADRLAAKAERERKAAEEAPLMKEIAKAWREAPVPHLG